MIIKKIREVLKDWFRSDPETPSGIKVKTIKPSGVIVYDVPSILNSPNGKKHLKDLENHFKL